MNDILGWITSHPAEATAVGYGLLNLLNGTARKRSGWAGNVLDKVHLVADCVCLLTRRDAPGTLKFPGLKSR